jgi:hypothetical protein
MIRQGSIRDGETALRRFFGGSSRLFPNAGVANDYGINSSKSSSRFWVIVDAGF